MRFPLHLLCLLCALAGCGGATYADGVFEEGEVRFSIDGPGPDWRRLAVAEESDLAWAHEGRASVLHASGSCDPRLDIPLVSLTAHLLVGFTDREELSQERRPFAGREALDTHLRAKLDGVTRELRLVVLKKDDCVYDFGLVAPPGAHFDASNADFDRLLASFEAR